MARAAAPQKTNVITEDDGDDGESREVVVNGNERLERLAAPQQPVLRNAQQQADDQFEAFEVDDKGRPLNPATQGRDDQVDDGQDDDDPDRREATLSEDDQGRGEHDEPLINGKGRGNERWESRSSRRERQRNARARKDKENDDLKAEIRRLRAAQDETEPRLAHIEKRFSKEAATNLENNVTAATAELDAAKKAFAKALREGDEETVVAALDKQQAAFVAKLQAEGARDEYKRRAPEDDDRDNRGNRSENRQDDGGDRRPRRDQPASKLSARGLRRVDEFCAQHDWFDPNGGDEDSQLTIFIDNQVRKAGFNPENDDYWDELNKRLAARLPEHFEDEDDAGDRQQRQERQPARRQANGHANGDGRRERQQAQPERRGPMTSGAAEQRSSGGGKNQVKVTPERKKALIDAGVVQADGTIADPPKFQRMLRQYADFDRTHGLTKS